MLFMLQFGILKTKTCVKLLPKVPTLSSLDVLDLVLILFLFPEDDPNPDAVKAATDLMKCGVDVGHLKADYKVVAHRQLISTESPGRRLYQEIRTWPEWLEDVSSIKN